VLIPLRSSPLASLPLDTPPYCVSSVHARSLLFLSPTSEGVVTPASIPPPTLDRLISSEIKLGTRSLSPIILHASLVFSRSFPTSKIVFCHAPLRGYNRTHDHRVFRD